MSAGAAALGLVNTLISAIVLRDFHMSMCAGFFFLMEALQVAQYLVIDECAMPINRVLTVLGLLHIAFQPVFSNLVLLRFAPNDRARTELCYAIRLSVLGGLFLFGRWVFASLASLPFPDGAAASHEWMVGPRTCSFHGPTHVGWELPMLEVSYWTPSFFVHFFTMFGPMVLLAVSHNLPTVGFGTAFMFLTGPVLAAFISGDRFEQPAIWCFFSVSQIVVMYVYLLFIDPSKKSETATASGKKTKGH